MIAALCSRVERDVRRPRAAATRSQHRVEERERAVALERAATRRQTEAERARWNFQKVRGHERPLVTFQFEIMWISSFEIAEL